jgi:uncharacterized Ntn-hydrolase superfamily protein
MRVNLNKLLVLAGTVLFSAGSAWATFSIVAVDTATGEVGGAGASCITGSRIINDVIMGTGAIHTQSFYLAGNQSYAHDLMIAGFSPEQIIDSLEAYDFSGTPGVRQYGIVDLLEGSRSAAFTGEECMDWAGHRVGPTYAIQGNILLGPEIVDSMEYAFTHTGGMLSDRLMAALNAAKVPGADTRCLGRGTSAISAFIRVARIADSPNEAYCDLNVNTTTGNTEPIDVLMNDYDEWLNLLSTSADQYLSSVYTARDTLQANGADTTMIFVEARNNQGESLGDSLFLIVWTSGSALLTLPEYIGHGIYTLILTAPSIPCADTISVFSSSGERQRELAQHPIMHYIEPSTVERPENPLPEGYSLKAHPNPFNSSTMISFSLERAQRIRLEVFDLMGRQVRVLTQEDYPAGTHKVTFDGTSLSSGIYLVRLSSGNSLVTIKVVLMK